VSIFYRNRQCELLKCIGNDSLGVRHGGRDEALKNDPEKEKMKSRKGNCARLGASCEAPHLTSVCLAQTATWIGFTTESLYWTLMCNCTPPNLSFRRHDSVVLVVEILMAEESTSIV
jgi:hypothetical protein